MSSATWNSTAAAPSSSSRSSRKGRRGECRDRVPGRLAASLLKYIGHPAYGPDALRADLDRFTFLRGGSDGEDLVGLH